MHAHRVPGRHLARSAALVAVTLVLAGATVITAVGADGDHQVTLCHATRSRTNPYVVVTVDYHSIVQKGHGSHDGPVFAPDLPKHTRWGDIIPAFDFGPDAQFDGQNLADGQAILDNGCDGQTPPTTTPTTEPTTAPTTEPTTAPTTAPTTEPTVPPE